MCRPFSHRNLRPALRRRVLPDPKSGRVSGRASASPPARSQRPGLPPCPPTGEANSGHLAVDSARLQCVKAEHGSDHVQHDKHDDRPETGLDVGRGSLSGDLFPYRRVDGKCPNCDVAFMRLWLDRSGHPTRALIRLATSPRALKRCPRRSPRLWEADRLPGAASLPSLLSLSPGVRRQPSRRDRLGYPPHPDVSGRLVASDCQPPRIEQSRRSERPQLPTPSSGVDLSNTRNRMTTKAIRALKRAEHVTRLLVAASDSDVGSLF